MNKWSSRKGEEGNFIKFNTHMKNYSKPLTLTGKANQTSLK